MVRIYCGSGCDGFGQTSSLVASEQKSQIFSNKYHCLCNERPAGVMMSVRRCADGDQVLSFVSLI